MLKWNVVGNKPSFPLNLVIIAVANATLLQKIFGHLSEDPRKAKIISRSGVE